MVEVRPNINMCLDCMFPLLCFFKIFFPAFPHKLTKLHDHFLQEILAALEVIIRERAAILGALSDPELMIHDWRVVTHRQR